MINNRGFYGVIDMEKKYILILADGSIMKTENGKDIKVGNALVDDIIV